MQTPKKKMKIFTDNCCKCDKKMLRYICVKFGFWQQRRFNR